MSPILSTVETSPNTQLEQVGPLRTPSHARSYLVKLLLSLQKPLVYIRQRDLVLACLTI